MTILPEIVVIGAIVGCLVYWVLSTSEYRG